MYSFLKVLWKSCAQTMKNVNLKGNLKHEGVEAINRKIITSDKLTIQIVLEEKCHNMMEDTKDTKCLNILEQTMF
jgi:hypothetical protein